MKVYQITSLREISSQINELGWTRASEKFLEVRAHLECSFRGSEGWQEDFTSVYQHVADVATNDPEEAFRLMNVWDDPESVKQLGKPVHSLSVGDILVADDGTALMVDSVGFRAIPFTPKA